MSRGSSERAFRKAQRHSRIVRILRVVLPALTAVTTVGIIISTYLDPLLAPPPASVDKMVISGSRVTMDYPRMTGYTHDGHPYVLKADTAVQDLTKPDMIELHKINAKVEMEDRSTVHLTAANGDYNSKAGILNLDRSILITSSNGYQGQLKDARVNIKTGHVMSDKPVVMTMLEGTLEAKRMEITNSGDLIKFENGVRLTTSLNTANVKDTPASANADDSGAPRSNTAARSGIGGSSTGTARTPVRSQRVTQAISAQKGRIWLRLPPRDPRRVNPPTIGSIR